MGGLFFIKRLDQSGGVGSEARLFILVGMIYIITNKHLNQLTYHVNERHKIKSVESHSRKLSTSAWTEKTQIPEREVDCLICRLYSCSEQL